LPENPYVIRVATRLVRVAAQISALELVRVRRRDVERLISQLDDKDVCAHQVTSDWRVLEDQLEAILRQRLSHEIQTETGPGYRVPGKDRSPGLILIHGTHLMPDHQPKWSEPGGTLFEFIREKLRSDIYVGHNPFCWEGGYNDRARDVAAQHLNEWIEARKMSRVDAVTHSHGGNVLMKATERGTTFGHVLLLSCPVRRGYDFREGSVITARSVRTSFDLAILADRGGQRFAPRSGIVEQYLPWWFQHSKTTCPSIWKRYNIRV